MTMEREEILNRFGVTDEELEQWEKDASEGIFPGEPGKLVMGRPKLCDEPLRAITITLPESMVAKIDARCKNRSEFIRNAIAACL